MVTNATSFCRPSDSRLKKRLLNNPKFYGDGRHAPTIELHLLRQQAKFCIVSFFVLYAGPMWKFNTAKGE